MITPNHVQPSSDIAEPRQVSVTDITCICRDEGWLHLAVALDLLSRQMIGGSTQARMHRELALDALLMAVCRRQPLREVIVHSDQGS